MIQEKIGKHRWTICSLVFFATTINYLDRAVISLLKSNLEKEFHWSESDYSNIVIAFQLSYAIGMLGAGRLIDKLGTRIGYALSIFLWSVAAVGHGLVRSTLGFVFARAALGASEAGNFPAAIKTVAEWFPKKERALATGIFNAGTNVGAILAPLTVPWIAEYMGWRWAFILTGAIGFIWIIFWFILYEVPAKSKKLKKAEFDHIHSDIEEGMEEAAVKPGDQPKTSWTKLLSLPQTWAFVVGKFLTDPVWWFYLFWLPAFLTAEYGLNGTDIALPVALVYTLASFGSVLGGWLPLVLIKKGWPLLRARRTSMLIYAVCVIPVVFAQYLGSINMWLAVLIIGLAASAHQAWSANLFTTVSDRFANHQVASVTGIGGMGGALGGVLIAALAGKLFDYYKAQGHIEIGYYIMFIICGSAYLVAWLLMGWLARKKTAPAA
ncbi:MAG TPA: MFS transporter [Flavitalea sp.]|nr:MFS transporter [Flavitalea sp.]